MLLSAQAYRTESTVEARAAQLSVLKFSHSLVMFFHGHTSPVYSVAFSPDGKTLASASADTTVRLWNVASHQSMGPPLTGHTDVVFSVAFSPDGRTLASASFDKTVRLWDVATRRPLGDPLTGHSGTVVSVAFSPDGKTLASAVGDIRNGPDNTVQLWDVASRQPLGEPLTGHTHTVNSVAFSPDGKILASGSADGTVRLWDISADSWLERICRIANRNMTQAEWTSIMGTETPYQRTCPDLPPGVGAPVGAR
jgi:WD40 repeat protein